MFEKRKNRTKYVRTSIVRILLLSNSLHGTIESREKTSPDSEVTTEHWSASLNGCESTDATLAVRGVTEALDAVPDGTADCLWIYSSAAGHCDEGCMMK